MRIWRVVRNGMMTAATVVAVINAAGLVWADGAAPLIASYEMEPDPSAAARLVDSGPLHLNGEIPPSSYVPGHKGMGIRIGSDEQRVKVYPAGLADKIGNELTISAWVNPSARPSCNPVLCKRENNQGQPFAFGIAGNGRLYFSGSGGAEWFNFYSNGGNEIPLNQWTHVAVTYRKNGDSVLYVNGKKTEQREATYTLQNNDFPLVIGRDWYWDVGSSQMKAALFQGTLDSIHIFAVALSEQQITQDMSGQLATRAAKDADFGAPMLASKLRLVRYDMLIGQVNENVDRGRTRQTALRKGGPDAVDWPAITIKLDKQLPRQIFKESGETAFELPLIDDGRNRPLFQESYDNTIEPGAHWLRALKWMWGQTYIYSTDGTARSWMADYELWTFPVIIQGTGERDVRNVTLKYDGQTIYTSTGSLHSLTLLLPQNMRGKKYSLTVAGGAPVEFDVGLMPIEPGKPVEQAISFQHTISGGLSVASLSRPEEFPNQKKWDEDIAALNKPIPASITYVPRKNTLDWHFGIDTQRSPLTVYFNALPHGMSSGSFFESTWYGEELHKRTPKAFSEIGSADDYADYLSDTGYDLTIERAFIGSLEGIKAGSKDKDFGNLARALADHGVRIGFSPSDWDIASPSHPNIAFFSYNLPRYHQPIYRQMQLGMQRLRAYPNAMGAAMGADNGAYISFWDWAPPVPNRPWGEAYINQRKGRPAVVPMPAQLDLAYSHSVRAKNVAEFVDWVGEYDLAFGQYGYFAHAISEVDPKFTLTTGSFGSSPGIGAGGGWPWATVPGKVMFKDMSVLQAYDWNELLSSKPMHIEALVDRLRSYYPDKPCWALIDDFVNLFGREARQRQYALALTRGVKSVGTTFLANPMGAISRREIIKEQKELYDWIHKFGGAYAMTEPTPVVGIMYVNTQSLMRPIDQGAQETYEGRIRGGHEGKTSEALFFCHAAGLPAKIITPEELKRGLPKSIKVILLTGLNVYDDSWHWYDGIERELSQFTAGGGKIVADDESTAPLQVIKTDMVVRSFIAQRNMDWTPDLLKRNQDNISKLRAAVKGVNIPVAESDSQTVWAVPTIAGNTQYLTVVNQATPVGKNGSEFVEGQIGTIKWNTTRPIYDVRLGKKITPQEAQRVNLMEDGFQWYALPVAEVTVPQVNVTRNASGQYEAAVTISNPSSMTGIPVEIVIHTAADSSGRRAVRIYTATGMTAALPLAEGDPAGEYVIKATELLSGLNVSTKVKLEPKTEMNVAAPVELVGVNAIRAFGERLDVPLTIGMTPAQAGNASIKAVCDRLVRHYQSLGRKVVLGSVDANGIVLSLQEQVGFAMYPQWRTIDSDLVLIGKPNNNVLLMDQARGFLLPSAPASGKPMVCVTYSPFVGERQSLNLLASDAEAMDEAVSALINLPRAPGAK